MRSCCLLAAQSCIQHQPHTPCVTGPRFLEEELARRYREAAPATLALLQERCEAVAKELLALEARIQACSDVASLRRAGGWRKARRCRAGMRPSGQLVCRTSSWRSGGSGQLCVYTGSLCRLHTPAYAGMAYAASMASHVQAILEGSSDPDPSQHGMTSDDERARCNMAQVCDLGA